MDERDHKAMNEELHQAVNVSAEEVAINALKKSCDGYKLPFYIDWVKVIEIIKKSGVALIFNNNKIKCTHKATHYDNIINEYVCDLCDEIIKYPAESQPPAILSYRLYNHRYLDHQPIFSHLKQGNILIIKKYFIQLEQFVIKNVVKNYLCVDLITL